MCHRAEGEPGESTSSARAHDQQIRAGRQLDQRVGGMALPYHGRPHLDARRVDLAEDPLHQFLAATVLRLAQRLLGPLHTRQVSAFLAPGESSTPTTIPPIARFLRSGCVTQRLSSRRSPVHLLAVSCRLRSEPPAWAGWLPAQPRPPQPTRLLDTFAVSPRARSSRWDPRLADFHQFFIKLLVIVQPVQSTA